MDEVESITFQEPPRAVEPKTDRDKWISKDLADKLVDKGIELFYLENGTLKKYQKQAPA